jgi:hypothetical protein
MSKKNARKFYAIIFLTLMLQQPHTSSVLTEQTKAICQLVA